MSNFKRAVRTTVIFLLVLTLLSIAIMETFFAGENYYYQDYNERAELAGTLDFLVCGASHAMRGFKPDVLDEYLGVNSYNLSSSRMTMQGRYELLKLEIERNPVKTLVLELSYDSLTRNRDEEGPEGDIYMLGKMDGFAARSEYFMKSVRFSEYGQVYYRYISNGINCLKKVMQGTWTDKNEKVYKGYAPYEREDMKLRKDLEEIYHTGAFAETVYEDNRMYLRKIIDMCKEKDIRLILVTMPLSKVTVCRYSNLDVFRSWYEDIAEENGLKYYDFNLLKERDKLLSDETAFSDRFHLGNDGATVFSEIFVDVLQKADAGEDISSMFCNNYEEIEKVLGLVE